MSFIETLHGGEFIIAELGALSRDSALVVADRQLAAGTVVARDGDGHLDAYTGSGACAGVLLYPVDTRDGAKAAAYIARRARVRFDLLTVPEGFDATTAAALEAQTIIVSSDSVLVDTGGGGGGPTPTVVIDFENGIYTVGATSYAATDLCGDDIDDSGQVFHPENIGVGGLLMELGSTGGFAVIGAARTVWLAGATAVLDLDVVSASGGRANLVLYDAATFNTYNDLVLDVTHSTIGGGGDPNDSTLPGWTVGTRNKVAITTSSQHLDVSINGAEATVHPNTVWAGTAPDRIEIFLSGAPVVVRVRSVKLYAVQDSGDLAALSTIA